MSVGRLYNQFVQQISNMETNADDCAEANLGETQRNWRVPYQWIVGPFDIQALGTPFSRTEMNEAYPAFFDNEKAKVADCMSAKMQADHLASQERAFRLRHASVVRCGMHAAGRRKGQGDSASGSFARIVNHIQDVIVSGGSG